MGGQPLASKAAAAPTCRRRQGGADGEPGVPGVAGVGVERDLAVAVSDNRAGK